MSKFKRLTPFLAVLALAGCGGGGSGSSSGSASTASPATVVAAERQAVSLTGGQCSVRAGAGFLGACTPRPVQAFGAQLVPVTRSIFGGKFPDVSSFQRVVNWPAVIAWQKQHGWTPGGIFKMGEFVLDPFAAHNAAALHALHAVAEGYWFVRNTGCAHESQQIIAEARALGVKVVWLDLEVPEARGYGACLLGPVRAAGFTVGAYTAPGTYPGGAQGVPFAWMAAYGPAHPPASPFGGAIKAFQCTDGIFGCVTVVPGLGKVDVSIDFGALSELGKPSPSTPPPPKPQPKPQPKPKPNLKPMPAHLNWFSDGAFPAPKYLRLKGLGAFSINERMAVRDYVLFSRLFPSYQDSAATARRELLFLRNRIWAVAHRGHGPVDWGYAHRGYRFHYMYLETKGLRPAAVRP